MWWELATCASLRAPLVPGGKARLPGCGDFADPQREKGRAPHLATHHAVEPLGTKPPRPFQGREPVSQSKDEGLGPVTSPGERSSGDGRKVASQAAGHGVGAKGAPGSLCNPERGVGIMAGRGRGFSPFLSHLLWVGLNPFCQAAEYWRAPP